ncbi:CapA family protein [Actinomycetospora chibensis]|uniref:CapA family protein n=1 Tax=Actinomycetospora chibensis TaxID=663606 RepID=A0ABV9RJF0_9PSEU|nr:CapA family protein [Actinomycetospora chibensis]MDD7926100.1 CapA family protein [Actinomycetospora chibensis]
MRLTPDDGETVALQFGGDVMMGRRFFDNNEDGRLNDSVISNPSDLNEHTGLLSSVAPLLRDADVTSVNVESPVTDEPYIDPRGPRPARVHPTKEFVFASGPALPPALAGAGVDVVGLANNHQYDFLEDGVRSTVESFAAAGFGPGLGQFGLGNTVDAAYTPAVIPVKGARIAFLGCTTITGAEHSISYVAGPAKGGAAPCEPNRVRDSIAAAKASGAVVVFSVHGGFEYGREPADQVRSLTTIARAAGATLVVNAHPHVVGGLDWDGGALTAWSLGNLVFDQTVWPTFQSYVLNVHVRRGQIVRAFLEPIMVERYVAHGLRSDLANYVNRTAAGLSRGPFLLEDGALELQVAGRERVPARRSVMVPASPAGTIAEVGDGWALRGANPRTVEPGTDLLWTGDFENSVLGSGPGALWTHGPDNAVVHDPAPGRGLVYQLRRDGNDAEPVVGTTIHRALLANPGSEQLLRQNRDEDDAGTGAVRPGPRPVAQAQVSMEGMVRLAPGARLEVQLSWFSDTRGPSSSQTVRVIEGGREGMDWHSIRIDAITPPDAVAVGVFLRLSPPTASPGEPSPPRDVSAGLDALRLVEWSPPGSSALAKATHVRTVAGGQVELERSGTAAEPFLPPLAARPVESP